jgi:hypothetical protein
VRSRFQAQQSRHHRLARTEYATQYEACRDRDTERHDRVVSQIISTCLCQARLGVPQLLALDAQCLHRLARSVGDLVDGMMRAGRESVNSGPRGIRCLVYRATGGIANPASLIATGILPTLIDS